MATEFAIWDQSYATYGDLRSNQFYFVEFVAGSDKIVQKTSAVVALLIGILQNNPNSGDTAVVRHLGVSKCMAATPISSAGLLIGCEATGAGGVRYPVVDSGEYAIATSIETNVSGDLFGVIVSPIRITAGL